ncbi:MAG: MFS transporter [Bacillota bacterium]|nr:MFS transporter [Bacillota bacterium]
MTEKQKPPLFTLNFILIWLATFCLMMIFYTLNTTLPIYIEELSGSVRFAGMAVTALTVSAIIARLVGGYLLDRYGRKIIFLLGVIFFLIPTIIYYWMVPVLLLIMLRFVQGLGWGISHTSVNTIAMDILPKERLGEGTALYTLSFSTAMAIAPAVALWFISYYPFNQLFLISSVVILVAIIFVVFIKYTEIIKKKESMKKSSPFKIKTFIEKKVLRPAATGFIVMFACSSVMAFLALFAYDIGLTTAGLFFTAMAITTFISRPFAGMIISRAGRKGYNYNMLLALSMLIISVILLSQATQLHHLVISGLIHGVGSGFNQSTLMVIVADLVPPEKRGRAMATYWASIDSGVSAGSLFWGFVAAAVGYRLMYIFAIIPLGLAFVVFFAWKKIFKGTGPKGRQAELKA